jgi:hypothetical protein
MKLLGLFLSILNECQSRNIKFQHESSETEKLVKEILLNGIFNEHHRVDLIKTLLLPGTTLNANQNYSYSFYNQLETLTSIDYDGPDKIASESKMLSFGIFTLT